MTKEQSVFLMNILATLFRYISTFPYPPQFLHALDGFEATAERVHKEMDNLLDQCKDTESFLNVFQKKSLNIISEQNQRNVLKAYHTCIWLDQILTYDDISEGKLSLYYLIPLGISSYVSIGALNDNYEATGIWINPKLPVFQTVMTLDNGMERERPASNRDAFYGINGELVNICYSVWNRDYIVHNIIIPYEYNITAGNRNRTGNLRIGFVPVSDKHDLIIPDYKTVSEGSCTMKKMYVNSPRHEDIINSRLQYSLELACTHAADIVFAPEMLGTEQTEQCTGHYNLFIRKIYGHAVRNGNRPPLVTIMPSYWHDEVNNAAIIYRDGSILGRQKKHTPYIDFKSCSAEGIRMEKVKEIYLLHIYGIHRIVISICAEFISGFDKDLICGQLGATMVIVPSYSHGERDFVSTLGTLFPYGTSVVWGDCCGAVAHSPRITGGYSLIGSNEICQMGSACKCGFSCSSGRGCLFLMDLPLKINYSKDTLSSHQPIQHILS